MMSGGSGESLTAAVYSSYENASQVTVIVILEEYLTELHIWNEAVLSEVKCVSARRILRSCQLCV